MINYGEGKKIINEITKFIFLKNSLEKADIIFIPGGVRSEPMEMAANLYLEEYAPYILPSGRYSLSKGKFEGPINKKDTYNKEYKTEWEFMQDIGLSYNVPSEAILKEDEAEWTKENAFNSRKVTDEKRLEIKKAIICCKSYHARRALMLYSWAYPKTKFIICPIEYEDINSNNWFNSDKGIKTVMGELSRCGGQLKKAVCVWSNINEFSK